MNSITKVVTVRYGANDEPQPLFECPVVIDPNVLQVLRGTENRIETLVNAAACAVELVSRFERASRYVDFAPRLNLAIGALPIALRVQLVRGRIGQVARIEFADTDPRH